MEEVIVKTDAVVNTERQCTEHTKQPQNTCLQSSRTTKCHQTNRKQQSRQKSPGVVKESGIRSEKCRKVKNDKEKSEQKSTKNATDTARMSQHSMRKEVAQKQVVIRLTAMSPQQLAMYRSRRAEDKQRHRDRQQLKQASFFESHQSTASHVAEADGHSQHRARPPVNKALQVIHVDVQSARTVAINGQHVCVSSSSRDAKPYRCQYCGERFTGYNMRRAHEHKRHAAELVNATQPHHGRIAFQRCPRCNELFCDLDTLLRHLTDTHDDAGWRVFICGICQVAFEFRHRLKHHVRAHAGIKEHLCPTCGVAFSTKKSLQVHLPVHTGDKPFRCDLCDRRFLSRANCRKHMNTHEAVKPYHCGVCGKGLASEYSLELHGHQHSGNKPYCCFMCDRAYSSASTLRLHINEHTGNKPYPCSYCDERFFSPHARRLHQHVHSGKMPYECSECEKSFATKPALKKHHLKWHSDSEAGGSGVKEKSYVCLFCDRTFIHKESMSRHLLRHDMTV